MQDSGILDIKPAPKAGMSGLDKTQLYCQYVGNGIKFFLEKWSGKARSHSL